MSTNTTRSIAHNAPQAFQHLRQAFELEPARKLDAVLTRVPSLHSRPVVGRRARRDAAYLDDRRLQCICFSDFAEKMYLCVQTQPEHNSITIPGWFERCSNTIQIRFKLNSSMLRARRENDSSIDRAQCQHDSCTIRARVEHDSSEHASSSIPAHFENDFQHGSNTT